jgi:ubiquinone/menaquinone biosynthesis C-methylase UbiE
MFKLVTAQEWDNVAVGIGRDTSNKTYYKAINLIKPQGNILDIGCGEGRLLELLIHIQRVKAIGVEYSIKRCKMAKRVGEIIQANAKKLPFKNNTLDLIFMVEVIEHIPNPNEALQECYRVLKDEGFLIITTPNGTSLKLSQVKTIPSLISYFIIKFASYTRYAVTPQPYDKPMTFKQLVKTLNKEGFEITESSGFYYFVPYSIYRFLIHYTPISIEFTEKIEHKLDQFPLWYLMCQNVAIKCKKALR